MSEQFICMKAVMLKKQKVNPERQQRFSEDVTCTDYGYSNISFCQSELDSDVFCNETFSLYEKWLRHFFMFACLWIFILMFVISYMLFFRASKAIWDWLLLIDVLYTYVVFLRSRTGYIIDGIEERNLLKVRKNYNRSWSLALDVISLIPLGIIAPFFPEIEDLLYAVGRQKQYLRIHFVTYYLGMYIRFTWNAVMCIVLFAARVI